MVEGTTEAMYLLAWLWSLFFPKLYACKCEDDFQEQRHRCAPANSTHVSIFGITSFASVYTRFRGHEFLELQHVGFCHNTSTSGGIPRPQGRFAINLVDHGSGGGGAFCDVLLAFCLSFVAFLRMVFFYGKAQIFLFFCSLPCCSRFSAFVAALCCCVGSSCVFFVVSAFFLDLSFSLLPSVLMLLCTNIISAAVVIVWGVGLG